MHTFRVTSAAGRQALLPFVLVSLAALTMSCGGGGGGAQNPTAPNQDAGDRPGGSTYAFEDVVETESGTGGTAYWVFKPANATKMLPVVVFMHGWGALTPNPYRDWMEHIVKRGHIVIYPKYQATLFTPPAQFTDNAAAAIVAALSDLEAAGEIQAPTTEVCAAGHSFGGVLSANLAAEAASRGLPAFRAILCATPGSAGFTVYSDYADIPSDTLILCVEGEDDTQAQDTDAKIIFDGATAVGVADKDYIIARTDTYGVPDITADHAFPTDTTLNALDWYGLWKWFDALTDNVFRSGLHRDYALGNTTEQRFMGRWSDGTPVLEPIITDTP